MSGELTQVYGTAQTVLTTAGTVANNNYSSTTITEYDNTTDAVTPNAQSAVAVLSFTFSVAPTVTGAIVLGIIRKNVDGTNDNTGAPSGTTANNFEPVGFFRVSAVTTLQRDTCVIDTTGIKACDFYILNEATGQTLSAGAVLKVTPLTLKAL